MRSFYVLLLLASVSVHAQVTIPIGYNTGSVGSSFDQFATNYVPPGMAGANQTYDLSTLQTTGGPETSTVVTVSSTPTGTPFTNATVAILTGTDQYSFNREIATELEFLGFTAAGGLVELNCNANGRKTLELPMSFNDSFSDSYTCTGSNVGQPFSRTGNVTVTADGYGDLIMPYGTVQNVLRIHVDETWTDIVAGQTLTGTTTVYGYFKPGFPTAIASVSTQNYAGTNSMAGTMLDPTLVSVNELSSSQLGLELFPNPATENVDLMFSSPGGAVQAEVYSIDGKVVIAEQFTAQAAGIVRNTLNVGTLAPGTYSVKIQASNGSFGVQRLVVQ